MSNGAGERNRWEFYVHCRQKGMWTNQVAGLDPIADGDAVRAYCPQHLAAAGFPPTFLAHGDLDADVPAAQSERMHAKLSGLGVNCQWLKVPQGAHGFDSDMRRPEVERVFIDLIAFLKKHVI